MAIGKGAVLKGQLPKFWWKELWLPVTMTGLLVGTREVLGVHLLSLQVLWLIFLTFYSPLCSYAYIIFSPIEYKPDKIPVYQF